MAEKQEKYTWQDVRTIHKPISLILAVVNAAREIFEDLYRDCAYHNSGCDCGYCKLVRAITELDE